MSAKAFEMAKGGGGEALRTTTTSSMDWTGGYREGVWAVRRPLARAIVTPPALLLNLGRLVPLSSSYLETGIFLRVAFAVLAANALQPGERKYFFSLFPCCAQGRVCGHMRARTCAMQQPV